jgi:hypothetical protein
LPRGCALRIIIVVFLFLPLFQTGLKLSICRIQSTGSGIAILTIFHTAKRRIKKGRKK